MIIRFNKYELVEEKLNINFGNLINCVLIYFAFFNGLDDTKQIKISEVIKYTKNFDIKNNDKIVKDALNDMKDKVLSDDKILNKKEVVAYLDSIAIVRKKDDKISKAMYGLSTSNGTKASSFAISLDKSDFGYNCDMIFLDDDADYNEIIHELTHVIKNHMKLNTSLDFEKLFNFNKSVRQQKKDIKVLTGGLFEYSIDTKKESEFIEYIQTPSELYSRLTSFKMFLYKRGYLKTPNEDFSPQLIRRITNGSLYAGMSARDRHLFINSDFLDILLFIDRTKIHMLDQFVQNISKNNDLA